MRRIKLIQKEFKMKKTFTNKNLTKSEKLLKKLNSNSIEKIQNLRKSYVYFKKNSQDLNKKKEKWNKTIKRISNNMKARFKIWIQVQVRHFIMEM